MTKIIFWNVRSSNLDPVTVLLRNPRNIRPNFTRLYWTHPNVSQRHSSWRWWCWWCESYHGVFIHVEFPFAMTLKHATERLCAIDRIRIYVVMEIVGLKAVSLKKSTSNLTLECAIAKNPKWLSLFSHCLSCCFHLVSNQMAPSRNDKDVNRWGVDRYPSHDIIEQSTIA